MRIGQRALQRVIAGSQRGAELVEGNLEHLRAAWTQRGNCLGATNHVE